MEARPWIINYIYVHGYMAIGPLKCRRKRADVSVNTMSSARIRLENKVLSVFIIALF